MTLTHDINQGRSAARNTGILNSHGEYLIFTDDDCILDPFFIENHIAFASPDIVVHGAIYNLSTLKFFFDPTNGDLYDELPNHQIDSLRTMLISEQDIKYNFEKIKKIARKTKYEKQVQIALEREYSKYPWISCTGGNIAVSTFSIKNIGGFDPHMGQAWGAEDLEMGYRLMKKGMKFIYLDQAPVYHIAHYRNGSSSLSSKALSYMGGKHKEFNHELAFQYFFNDTLDYEAWEKNTNDLNY